MRSGVWVTGLVLLSCAAGCRSQQLARDQDHIREAVLELHTNQILDNLVRVRKGLPIVQLDYTNMTGTITHTGSGSVGGGQTGVANHLIGPLADSPIILRALTTAITASGTAQQVNQLTITAQPVLNAPEVYNAYLTFLKEDDRLRETTEPPPCGSAIVVRWYYADCADGCGMCDERRRRWWHMKDRAKVYYWIPVEYEKEFRRLSLHTVAVRGQATAVSSNYEVTVLGELVEKRNKLDGDVYELYMKIDRKIPNDRGYMLATIKGQRYEDKEDLKIVINRTPGLQQAQPGDQLPENQQTSVVVLRVSLKALKLDKIEALVEGLAGQKVGIRLDNFAPRGSATDRLLEDIRTQLELFRLGQLQPTAPNR